MANGLTTNTMTAEQRRATNAQIVSTLINGGTRDQAAEAAGMTVHAVRCRLQDDVDLQRMLADAEHDVMERVSRTRASAQILGLRTLIQMASDVNNSPHVRVRAAIALAAERPTVNVGVAVTVQESEWEAASNLLASKMGAMKARLSAAVEAEAVEVPTAAPAVRLA